MAWHTALHRRPQPRCCCGTSGKVPVLRDDDRQRLISFGRIIDAKAELLVSAANNQMPDMLTDVLGNVRSEGSHVNGRCVGKACGSRREQDDGRQHFWPPEDGRLIGSKPSLVSARCATRTGCSPSQPTDSRVSAAWGVAHRASRDAAVASHQTWVCGV